ncbi:hypothetical protein TK90_2659 (plasmid) [Thioalkalivibrio sp. K90mix]|uniref:hypothetical protein n=1 Tax=Thioalkalivibrio sp. (strain K90mix) TaxID=396595 RepID=UPI000195A3AF|nr:hypothetical protein [Thioalkalivibrio sp. K90mix]ADC73146.1 hypothetical protein TK90_2659 [Thioalkalivibrio sp. K90mix]
MSDPAPTPGTIAALADMQSRQHGEDLLDDLVHDLQDRAAVQHLNEMDEGDDAEGALASFSREAADINNRGPSGQVQWLIEQMGEQRAYAAIEAAARQRDQNLKKKLMSAVAREEAQA